MLGVLRRLFRTEREYQAVRPPAPSSSPQDSDALYQRAMACLECDDLQGAERWLNESIKTRPDFGEAHLQLGRLMHRQGRLEEATDCYVMAEYFRPDLPDVYLHLGQVSLERGDYAGALEPLTQALELAPEDARMHNAIGAALLNCERVSEARTHFERALALRPDFAQAHSNLAYVLLRDYEEFDEGERHIQRALELAPEDPDVLCNWTIILQRRGDLQELMSVCDRLLAQHPDMHAARLNRGLALLTLGEFNRGWVDYEARKRARCNYVPPRLPWPEWDGSSLPGRRLYIHAEQGMGDQIMFASCVQDVLRQGAHCLLECNPKLEKIFRRSFPSATVISEIPRERAAGDFDIDCQCAMGSLPRFFRNKLADFPQHSGYLTTDAARTDYWRRRLQSLPGKLKVGISWRGGVKSTQQSSRSIPLEQWLPIFSVPDVDFLDLQYFECADEVARTEAKSGTRIHRWREALDDYDETAALVCALDLVISVQTALVHLTGALGREAWALISAAPEWRYLAHGETLPWYPAVRLIRQERLGDWEPVMQRTAQALMARVPDARQPRDARAG